MTVGSLFAGIAGFDEGFHQAGFAIAWEVEKEPFCRAVLKTRFPEAELFEDVRECGKHNLRPVDVITFGFPCQDLSVAGKRAGLGGARSGLFWEAHRILGELQPRWFVAENVPGIFSSGDGRDFALVIRELAQLGYGVAWRVLDSQHFGVAQRRRRVFIVGRLREPCPPEVLFDAASGEGDFAAGGETGQDVAAPLTSGVGVTGNPPGRRREDDINLAIVNLVATLNSGGNGGGFRTEPGEHIVTFSTEIDSGGVRSFAGLPEGMDSARYRALGNAVTVSVARWIAERIGATVRAGEPAE